MNFSKLIQRFFVSVVVIVASFSAISGGLNPDDTYKLGTFSELSAFRKTSFTDKLPFALEIGQAFTATVTPPSAGFTGFSAVLSYGTDPNNLTKIEDLQLVSGSFVSSATFDHNDYFLTVVGTVPSGSSGRYNVVLTGVTTPVPEPESYAMMLLGLGLVGATVRRRRNGVMQG